MQSWFRFSIASLRWQCLYVCLGILILQLSGCHRVRPGFGPTPFEDPLEVLAKVKSNTFEPRAYISDARVRLVAPIGRGSADHFLVVRAPGDLRLETLSFFGSPLALFLVAEDSFLFWEIEANRAWQGPATAEAISMVLPVAHEPEALAGILLARPPLFDEDLRLELDHERRRYIIWARRAGQWQRLVVHPEDYLLEELSWFDDAGDVSAVLQYRRYQEMGVESYFPYEMSYETEEGFSLRVLFRDINLDPDAQLLNNLFSVSLPEAVQILPLERGLKAPVIISE